MFVRVWICRSVKKQIDQDCTTGSLLYEVLHIVELARYSLAQIPGKYRYGQSAQVEDSVYYFAKYCHAGQVPKNPGTFFGTVRRTLFPINNNPVCKPHIDSHKIENHSCPQGAGGCSVMGSVRSKSTRQLQVVSRMVP